MGVDIHIAIEYVDDYDSCSFSCEQYWFGRNSELFRIMKDYARSIDNITLSDSLKTTIDNAKEEGLYGYSWFNVEDLENIRIEYIKSMILERYEQDLCEIDDDTIKLKTYLKINGLINKFLNGSSMDEYCCKPLDVLIDTLKMLNKYYKDAKLIVWYDC